MVQVQVQVQVQCRKAFAMAPTLGFFCTHSACLPETAARPTWWVRERSDGWQKTIGNAWTASKVSDGRGPCVEHAVRFCRTSYQGHHAFIQATQTTPKQRPAKGVLPSVQRGHRLDGRFRGFAKNQCSNPTQLCRDWQFLAADEGGACTPACPSGCLWCHPAMGQ